MTVTPWDEPAGATPRGTLVVLPGRGETDRTYERFGRRLAAQGHDLVLVAPTQLSTVLFRFVLERRWMPTQLAGIGALAAAGALAPFVPPVGLGVLATLILVAVGAAESVVRIREGRRHGG